MVNDIEFWIIAGIIIAIAIFVIVIGTKKYRKWRYLNKGY